jgi:hypothetical protein
MKVFKLLATLIQRQGNQSHIKQHGKKYQNSDKSYGHGDKRQNFKKCTTSMTRSK